MPLLRHQSNCLVVLLLRPLFKIKLLAFCPDEIHAKLSFPAYSTGVYLPLLWEPSFCWKSPIALGYTRGHFSALVAMENDGYDNRGAGANLNTDDDVTVTFLPLVDSDRKLLHVHFLSAQEVSGGFVIDKSCFV